VLKYPTFCFILQVAVKALPYKKTFVGLLNPQLGHVDEQLFLASLMMDVESFCVATQVIVFTLNDFFTSVKLNVTEQI